MNKLYAICITSCDIIDEINIKRSLKQYDLVQVKFLNEQAGKCSLKLLDEDLTSIKFNKTVYLCDLIHVQIVPHNILLFLVSADYGSRSNILQNEKAILDLKIDSKVTLKFIDSDKQEYAIEFVINYIGAIKKLGIGNFIGLNFAYFGRLREFGAILTKIHDKFHQKCDEVTSIIIVRVEQLFNDILLSEKKKNGINQTSQSLPEIPDQMERKNIQAKIEVDNNVFESNKSTTADHQNYTSEDLDVKKRTTMKMCMICDNLENLFTFSCNHPFCYRCIMKRLDFIKIDSNIKCPRCYLDLQVPDIELFSQFLDHNLTEEDQFKNKHVFHDQSLQKTTPHDNKILKGSNSILKSLDAKRNSFTICPKCGVILRNHHELELLTEFVNQNISTEETSSKTKDKQTSEKLLPVTNNKNWWQFNNDKKNGSTEKEKNKSGGNKIENRFCKSCRKQNNNSAMSCVSCHRPFAY